MNIETAKDEISKYIAANNFVKARQLIDDHKTSTDQLDTDIQKLEAVLCILTEELDKAERILLDIVKTDPWNFEAHFHAGFLYEKQKRIQSALKSFEAARKSAKTQSEKLDINTILQNFAYGTPDPAEERLLLDTVRDLKVLQGTMEIANQMHTISEALKRKDIASKTLCYYPNNFKYTADILFDIKSMGEPEEILEKTKQIAHEMLLQFDVFHFHFGTSLIYDLSDLHRYKTEGKKVVQHYWGSDVRLFSTAQKMNPYIKVKTHDEELLKRKMEFTSKYVSSCIVGDYELFEYVQGIFENVYVVPALIDLGNYPYQEPGRNEKFLIVHAPSSPLIKGTRHVVDAVEKLSDTYDFEFKLIRNMPHDEAKKWYARADLIVDELRCGSYGLLTLESLSMGKAVITWITDAMRDRYPEDVPVIVANPDTVREKIEYVLKNREIVEELGIKGRAYVKKYHDADKVAMKMLNIYNKL
jgi:glycosyltransferase involved in cell wall biosynthesis